ncbi:HAMP domain-containing sensor histidine kinase [Persicobacter psychrovividus]|uniref:histidine kinase n=1 Tax=Persicobacter psychrovividus TaxID=387638 RepID=A0ABN6LDC9_9BACT|nr:two-component sensor histidine kinase [Persicobacter psychrovividus]
MSQPARHITNRLIYKLALSVFFIILLLAAAFMGISFYYGERYFDESMQKVNAKVADHLISEKFKNNAPFLDDGRVNKALFGEIMHEMMAVNRSIEVYLLDEAGTVLYSVVLDHDDPKAPTEQVNLKPIYEFVQSDGQKCVLGDNPRDKNNQTIFSVAPYDYQGKKGFVYIIFESQRLQHVQNSIFTSYFLQGGLTAMLLVIIFACLLAGIAIWFLSKNLREIIYKVRRFQEGDLSARIDHPEENDLQSLAISFNEMADKIVSDMERIKSVDTIRRELIANVSHDLRTPLAILKGYTETLQMKGRHIEEADKQHFLEIIHQSSERLTSMVAQLFEYSKLEAKQVQPEKEPFLLTDLAHDLHAKNKVLANQKDIAFELRIHEPVAPVFADVKLVERAIQNLIDNALKFTPQSGTVTLEVSAAKEGIQIAIKDSGPGIPVEEQSYIFERYRQVASSKPKMGAGLGLAIVKKILELHQSDIHIQSAPNQGTSFYFSLPAYQA